MFYPAAERPTDLLISPPSDLIVQPKKGRIAMIKSNRSGVESKAPTRQAEVERQLRQFAEMRNVRSQAPSTRTKIKWAAIGATAISVIGIFAFVVTSHVR